MNQKTSVATPVLFLVFNRLDTTKKVFDGIRRARPPRIYVACDGARDFVEGEIDKVNAVRNHIIQNVDWECEVKTLFREKNLGCKLAVSGAIDWFFENEEMGIILEDDCLPSESFFGYCEALLNRYKDDLRVGQISGFNYGYDIVNQNVDYVFSKYPMIWGWATWRNRWANYDINLTDLTEIINSKQFAQILPNQILKEKHKIFDMVKLGDINTWDYQWSYCLYKQNQFTIIPKNNQILNLGFGEESTHTSGSNPYVGLENSICDYQNLIHPKYFVQDDGLYKLLEHRDSLLKRMFKKFLKR